MKRFTSRRTSTFLAAALLIIVALEVPALAAPPSNDEITSATPLGAPPRTFVQDTGEATARRGDGNCVSGSSVWFRSRRVTTRTFRLSTVGSDYDTVLAVFRGPRSNRTLIRCVDDSFEDSAASATQVRLVAGNTYWIAVSACCGRNAAGGRLVLNTFAPTSGAASVDVESVTTGRVSGRLLLTGTIRCSTPAEFELNLSASQRVASGANVARGDGFVLGTCRRKVSHWKASIDSDSGWAFQTGTQTVVVSLFGFADDGFSFAAIENPDEIFNVTEDPNARSSTSRN